MMDEKVGIVATANRELGEVAFDGTWDDLYDGPEYVSMANHCWNWQ